MKKKLLFILIVLFCGTAAYSETVIDFTGNIELINLAPRNNRYPVTFSVEPLFKIGVSHEFMINENTMFSIGGGIGDWMLLNPIAYGKGEFSFILCKGEKIAMCLKAGASLGVICSFFYWGLYLDQEVSLVLQSTSNKGFFGGVNLTINEDPIISETICISPGVVMGVKF